MQILWFGVRNVNKETRPPGPVFIPASDFLSGDEDEPLVQQIKQLRYLDRVIVVRMILPVTGIVPQSLTAYLEVLVLSHSPFYNISKYSILQTCSMLHGILGGSSR